MGKRIGVFCIILGFCCFLSAIGLVVYNRIEEQTAENSSDILLQDVQKQIAVQGDVQTSEKVLEQEMPVMQVDGYDCIGVLSIPVLALELPVLTDWSYAKLKIAPCHYFGTYHDANFVIAAHNYPSHFGRLSELQADDLIVFTDMNGEHYCYEVVLLETLPPNATKEMITSGFGLSLYTCTPGGGNRVTVRCNAVER